MTSVDAQDSGGTAEPRRRPMKLQLRPWLDADVGPLIAAYRDPELLRWTRFHVTDADSAAEWLESQRRGWAAGERFSLVVEDVSGPETLFLGNVALKTGRLPDGLAEVGYWTAPWARRRGVASVAVTALSQWAFATFALHRLELRHLVANEASCRVATRAGFSLAAELHEDGEDGHVHALTRTR
jgi:RimJ/RimL family protein N-acetyltransferase